MSDIRDDVYQAIESFNIPLKPRIFVYMVANILLELEEKKICWFSSTSCAEDYVKFKVNFIGVPIRHNSVEVNINYVNIMKKTDTIFFMIENEQLMYSNMLPLYITDDKLKNIIKRFFIMLHFYPH